VSATRLAEHHSIKRMELDMFMRGLLRMRARFSESPAIGGGGSAQPCRPCTPHMCQPQRGNSPFTLWQSPECPGCA
jgi:hypothetical protein